jgi:hypothetical protein
MGVYPKVVDGELKGGGVSWVMQSLQSTPVAHEAEEYPAMTESTTEIRIGPLPETRDVLTEILREGARRMLAQDGSATGNFSTWRLKALPGTDGSFEKGRTTGERRLRPASMPLKVEL